MDHGLSSCKEAEIFAQSCSHGLQVNNTASSDHFRENYLIFN